MSPRHFSRAIFGRQSQIEKEFEAKVEHAIAYAFSPVLHPVKTWAKLKRVFTRYRRQSES